MHHYNHSLLSDDTVIRVSKNYGHENDSNILTNNWAVSSHLNVIELTDRRILLHHKKAAEF